MSLRPSISAQSSDRVSLIRELQRAWPTILLLPVLYAVLHVSAVYPLIAMLFGPHSQMSDHHNAPSLIGLVASMAIGFWAAWLTGRLTHNATTQRVLMVASIVAGGLLWLFLEPQLDGRSIFSDPSTLVNSRSYLILPLFLALLCWVMGIQLGQIVGNMLPEELRQRIVKLWVVLVASLLIASGAAKNLKDDAMHAAAWCVPLLVVASIGCLALLELMETRRRAQRIGSSAPAWGRWLRLIGIFTLLALMVVWSVGGFDRSRCHAIDCRRGKTDLVWHRACFVVDCVRAGMDNFLDCQRCCLVVESVF